MIVVIRIIKYFNMKLFNIYKILTMIVIIAVLIISYDVTNPNF